MSGYDDVKFSWSKSTGATGYTVYYKESTSEEYEYLARTTALSIKKAGLLDGIKYDFKVVPYYKTGSTRYASANYAEASVITLKTMAAPAITSEGASEGKLIASWTNIEGADGVQIAHAKTKKGTLYSNTIIAGPELTSCEITAKKGYPYYKIRAYKVVNGKRINGPWSAATKY